ncbi:Gfo/Idh/MocA family protein [Planctobacterium marinum]|uniref:Dehydrogenase n=1 Tax=Planctobacterium marinum TaxID=1631968 RepID=A0AA48HEB1_9ALTE|nr:hypothetical protein MACH26_09140 [Planctobacterium marinum]
MKPLRIGIIGAGMIAGVIANAIKQSQGAIIAGVTSRSKTSAQTFASEQGITQVFANTEEMLASDTVDAVYIATPTSVKEPIAIAAAQAKKHLLVDKPFASFSSLERIIGAAQQACVAFMDATHFTHHPRTQQLANGGLMQEIGTPQALRSSFFFPFMDRANIRFDPEKEPTGAVGDMTWYSMRAIVEYLQPKVDVKAVSGSVVTDPETGAIIRGGGHIAFVDGKSSTFDFGYNAGVCVMDLDILGESGMVSIDDFVLDWNSGFAFDDPSYQVGYTKRSGMQTPEQWQYQATPSSRPQAVNLVESFAQIAQIPSSASAKASIKRALLTQSLLEQYWQAINQQESN